MTKLSSELTGVFCANMKTQRAKLGLTQQYVADEMGVSRARIAEVESGRFDPTLELVERIANAMGVDPDKLLKKPRIKAKSA